MSEGTERIVYGATITDKGQIKPDEVNATAGRLAKWKGRHVSVSVSRYVKSKTNPQLALYFGDGGVVHGWSEYTGYDRDEMHRELKRAYLVPQLVVARLTGEEIKELPSLRDLTVEEMSAYLERCLREGRQLGIVFNVDESSWRTTSTTPPTAGGWQTERTGAAWKEGSVSQCLRCGGPVKPVKPSQVRRGRGRYCSHSCAAAAAGPKDMTGARNPNWKGGVVLTPKEKMRRYVKKYERKHAAHRIVTNAIRRGELMPEPCRVCGTAPTQAHHEDYSKPLAVWWMCKRHHMDRHVQIRQHEIHGRTKPLNPRDVAILGGDPSQ